MTTVDGPGAVARVLTPTALGKYVHPTSDPTIQTLRTAVLGRDEDLRERVRTAVIELGDAPCSGLPYRDEAAVAPFLLRRVVAALGGSSAAIAADPLLRGALCEWSAVAAPHLLPILTGHFDLALGAIRTLGNGSEYQQSLLADLDSGAAVGELLLTELGGTNGADQQTTATWDGQHGGFWLDSPTVESWKFMPNIADPKTPKIGLVTARLLIDGRDEGVMPFLLQFRGSDGSLVRGLHLVALPDKPWAPMDHAMIRFAAVFVPRDALLGGDWAVMTDDGQLDCALPPRQRWHRAISVLGDGRLDLANAAAAVARAGLALMHNYAVQRRPGGRTAMVDRGTVRRDLISAVASTYAVSVLGRRVRQMRAAAADGDPVQTVWSMLAKPLLAYTSHQVLMTCRQRAAAQGSLRVNWLGDWIGLVEGVITAEGESQLMWRQAGLAHGSGLNITALQVPDTPPHLPWYVRMLADRELAIADGLRRDDYDVAGTAMDRDTAAIELAAATSERLAATAVATAAERCGDRTARSLLESVAAVYALERICERGSWYAAHRQMSPQRGRSVLTELQRHRQIVGAHLSELVDGFDVPLAALDAPMAAPSYVQWWRDWAGWYTTPISSLRLVDGGREQR